MAQRLKHTKPEQWAAKDSDNSQRQLPERPAVTEALLANMTQRIVEACHPEKVILFGSYAYGTPHKDSDIDLFVIMKPKYAEETNHQRVMDVTDVAEIPFLPMDVIVRTPHEVEKRIAMGDFFIKEILDRGKVLYERDAT